MTRRPGRVLSVEVEACTDLPIEVVWSALACAESFSSWVVGTREIRGADPGWPAPGSRLFHRWGVPPFAVRDHSEALTATPPTLLVMRAYARPVAVVLARIALDRLPDGRVRVRLFEDVESGLAAFVPPLTRAVQRWRNRRALVSLLRVAPTYGRGRPTG